MELPTHDQLDRLFLKAGTEFTLDGVHCVYVQATDDLDDFLMSEFDEREFVFAGFACSGCPRIRRREVERVATFADSPLCSPCHNVPVKLRVMTFEAWQRFQLLKE